MNSDSLIQFFILCFLKDESYKNQVLKRGEC
nr:MAG TPA: hypothetical protein [Caudoviricetes sp.]